MLAEAGPRSETLRDCAPVTQPRQLHISRSSAASHPGEEDQIHASAPGHGGAPPNVEAIASRNSTSNRGDGKR